MLNLKPYMETINKCNTFRKVGQVLQIVGLIIESDGPSGSIGDVCFVYVEGSRYIKSQIVGFREDRILLMPLGSMEGIRPKSRVVNMNEPLKVKVGASLIGRVLDGLGEPIDGLGEIESEEFYPIQGGLINPLKRKVISEPLSLGVKSIDSFVTLGKGQRVGIFAGSGVGKSTTLGMIAKNTQASINVIALIGERGREVREFIESILGREGLKRSVVIVATSDQPSLVKITAAFVATSIAQYFRDLGNDVLFMLDSITRIAMAQREIGLAVGEPPATRGYTPSVFTLMPNLLEKVGNNDKGTITALYTVLVEGDDFNEPISDTVRSILDGHIMLSRDLAHKNYYPAVDILHSVSRVFNDITDEEHKKSVSIIRSLLAEYKKNEDLINIGAYVKGANPLCDKAILLKDDIDSFLKQKVDEKFSFEQTLKILNELSGKV